MSSTTTSFGGNFPTYTSTQVNGLADTKLASPTDGDRISWDSATSKWVNLAPDVNNLTDVSAATPADGDTLVWNSGTSLWENLSPVVNGLTDVTAVSPSAGHTLVWNATTSKWESKHGDTFITVTTDNTVGNAIYNAAEMLGGLILRDPSGGDRTDTCSSASTLVSTFTNAEVGSSFTFTVRNEADAAETITVAVGTGGTASGTMTVAQNAAKTFLVRFDNVTASSEAYTMYSLGSTSA
jgi:hypothetical protein